MDYSTTKELKHRATELIEKLTRDRCPESRSTVVLLLDQLQLLENAMRTFEQAVPVLSAAVDALKADKITLQNKLDAALANAKTPASIAAENAAVALAEAVTPELAPVA